MTTDSQHMMFLTGHKGAARLANIREVGNALLGVLKDSDLHDVTAALADSGAAIAAAGTVAENIPVVSTLVGLARVGSTISDQILARKLRAFLDCLSDISDEDRRSAIERVETDLGYRVNVGEQLLWVVDRADDEAKAQIIAWLFIAFVRGKGDYEMFRRAVTAVQGAYIQDLRTLDQLSDRSPYSDDIGQLVSTGMFCMEAPEIDIYYKPGNGLYAPEVPAANSDGIKYYMTSVGHFVVEALKDREIFSNQSAETNH